MVVKQMTSPLNYHSVFFGCFCYCLSQPRISCSTEYSSVDVQRFPETHNTTFDIQFPKVLKSAVSWAQCNLQFNDNACGFLSENEEITNLWEMTL